MKNVTNIEEFSENLTVFAAHKISSEKFKLNPPTNFPKDLRVSFEDVESDIDRKSVV